jgi:KAP family P-loop domain
MDVVQVRLFNDRSGTHTTVLAASPLADLFSYAHQWALREDPDDPATLSFSSMLAAMMESRADPLCGWLREHLALRGVRATSITKGHTFEPKPLPPDLTTTRSFRDALEKAKQLCVNETEEGLAVRHFMAAYAVIPAYHLAEFLKYRIDRRAWCLALAEHLTSAFSKEKDAWLKYASEANPVPSLGFNTDAPEGRDLLNVEREVEAFARLIASHNTATPLSVGVFGAWGSGKSFFMRRLRKRVESFASLGREEGAISKYHGWIAQIDFNAWHYSEGNLAASFVHHILHNLKVEPDDDTEELKKRSEVIVKQLDTAKQDLAARQKAVADAEDKRAQAQQELAELDVTIAGEIEKKKDEIATARSDLQKAQDKLAAELANLQSEIDAQTQKVPATAIASLLGKNLNNPEISKATNNVVNLIREVQVARQRSRLILYGLVVVFVIGGAAMAVMKTNIWAQLMAAVVAVGSLAGIAASWLKKLNDLAQRGKELEDEQEKMRQTIVREVTADYEKTISSLRTLAVNRLTIVDRLNTQLKKLETAPATARLALETLEKQRAVALTQEAEAAAVVVDKNAELARLTTGTLLDEFLDDRILKDAYIKDLTIFSRIRNDFERLSKLMTKATAEFRAPKKANDAVVGPPAVSRIVLYIDDLDRCSAERVVEVLKLVHLLLAFPLFVCVAAVDPRWITQSLEKAPGLIRDGDKPDLDDQVGEPATAADYLEKIFQIPLWLRPVPFEQRAAIVRTLLGSSKSSNESQSFPLVIAASKVVIVKDQRPEGPERESSTEVEDIDPDIISDDELEYLDQLAGLLSGNPRSLKRFVNTYRLVKTALSDVELAQFRKRVTVKNVSYSPYRICMAQLAVLCTQRTRALKFVQHADQTTENGSLEEWLAKFKKIEAPLAECFEVALSEDLKAVDVETFKLWLERTRRYSFYV